MNVDIRANSIVVAVSSEMWHIRGGGGRE